MKKYYIINLLIALCICSCSQDDCLKNQGWGSNGKKFTTVFEGNESRVYIDEEKKLNWSEKDQIALFDGNTLNSLFQFDGNTGDKSGTFIHVSTSSSGTKHDLNANYAVYPYASDVEISQNGEITATLPSKQSYVTNSFGLGANTMVAVTQDKEDTFLKFKNLGGYLKLLLYGDDVTVKSITLTGNNEEKIAGKATIMATSDATPIVCMADNAVENITLDCGEGVKVGSTSETATAFWMVIPPTTFEGGIMVTIVDIDGNEFTKSTSKKVTIERNVIKPMSTWEIRTAIPNNQIWYTSTDGAIIKPSVSDVFGANIISNNVINGKGIIKFDGAITTLGNGSFESCTTLSSITLPNSITSLEGTPFAGCNNLIAIYSKFASRDNRCLIKEGVLRSFAPGGLTSYTIPNTVTLIEDYVFADYNSMTNITIPNSVEKIGEGAFAGCSNLISIAIPDGVKSIGQHAFSGCNNVTRVTIPNSVTSIGICAFEDCTGELIVDCNIPPALSPVLYSGSLPFGHSKFSKVIIGDNVSTIGTGAFYTCKSITSITLGSHITSIEAAAFRGCSITSITLPESVKSMGYGVFYDCTNLVNVFCEATTPPSVDKGDGSKWEAFNNNAQDRKIYVPFQSLDIYKTADGWKEYANCIVSYDFELGEPVFNKIFYTTTDGKIAKPYRESAFDAEIVSNTYENGVGKLVFNADITKISSEAFRDCENILSVTIPERVVLIGQYIFYNCSNLTAIYCKATTPPAIYYQYYMIGSFPFKKGMKIYVPRAAIDAYTQYSPENWVDIDINQINWSQYQSYIEPYDF